MSQTKLNLVARHVFTSVPHFVCFLPAAAIILAMVLPVSAATVTWNAGGANLYWSTAANWGTNSVPLSTDDISFWGTYSSSSSPNYTGGTSGSASTVTNEVHANQTINSLTYNQVDSSTGNPGIVFHNTKIDPGVTLKIAGSYTYPDTTYGISGPYSFYAGANVTTVGLTTKTYFTGGGSLDISTSTGGNTGGDIVVRELSTVNGANGITHMALVDLSGLNTFNANIDQLLIGYSSIQNGTSSANQKATGSMYLARTNTITLNSTLNTPAQQLISGAGLVIGFDPGNGNASSNSINGSSSLYLGQTNTINVNNLWVAAGKSGGSLSFNTTNPLFTNSTLYMRGVNPTPGGDNTFIPVNYISVGDASGGGSNACTGIIDLTGGTVDILATTLIVARDSTVAQNNARPISGSLSFNGSISASTLSIGQHSFSGSYTNCTGTVYIGNGSHLTVSGEMQMASFAGGSVGSATANLNISGGTVTMGGDIDKGVTPAGTLANPNPATFPPPVGTSTASITLTGGTLDMGGHNIGTATVPIDYFTIHGGALNNVGNLSVTNFIAEGAVSPITGKVTIGNNGKIDMRDGAAHTVSAANMTLAGASTLYFELGADTNIGDSDYINLNGGTLNVSSSGMSIFISRLGDNFAAAPNNTYTLISYGTLTGSSTLAFTNTTRSNMVPNLGATALTLQVTNVPGHHLTWNGGTSGTWDVINSNNKVWTSPETSPLPDMYYDGDNVTFGTQSLATIITLSNTASSNGVVPSSVTVNSATDYTFNAASSTDRISGTTGLTKLGTGTLYMNLANDYIGTTNLGTTLNPNAGKTVLGNATALGNASAPLIIASNATLDLNTYQLYAKPITVQGAGADGNGAIVNNSATAPAGTQYDVSNVTLSGDTTIGGTSTIVTNSSGVNSGLPGNQYIGRWSFRAQTGQATLSTSGQPYNLTKTGNNQIMLVDTNVDTALANVTVNEGVLSLESTTTLGNPAGMLTVDGSGAGQPAGGSILQLRNLSVPLNKQVTLKNNGQLYALINGSDTDNTIAGGVYIDSTGGIMNAGGLRADYTSNTPNSSARININGPISGSGPLTKTGPGTVTLNNSSSTFNGTTTVNDGVLIVNGALRGNITIAPIDPPGNPPISPQTSVAPTLAGTGTIGAGGGTVTVGGTTSSTFGGVIAPGPNNTTGSVGTLTLNNLTFNSTNTTNGGTINLDLSTSPSSGNDLLTLTGNLSLTATAKTNIAINEISGPGSLTNGTYRLINYSGSKTGTAAANLNLTGLTGGSRRTYNLDDSVLHQINLNVGGASASLTWVGDGISNQWDFANASNTFWSGASPNIFYNLDSVTFTDSGNNAIPIDISSSTSTYVQPSSITVSAAKDYTFNGSSKITGATGLTKSGTGKLILNNGSYGNTNDFSGPITINAGILQIGDGGTQYTSIGTGSITNNAQLIFNQYENHTVAGIISGSGSLEQKGSNSVITLSGANTYDGITTVSAGALQAGNNSALGSTVAGTTIAFGATLDINNMNLGSEQITVQGPGVGGSLGGVLCNGAIVNSNTSSSTTPQQALRFVTLTGDTTFGGQSSAGVANSGRWDIRGTTSSPSTLSTGGHAYNLTKTGNNQVSLVATTVDPMLANVNINQGVLELELTSTLGNSSGIVTVDSSNATSPEPTETLDNGTLQFYNQATPLNKIIVLQNGGILYAKNNNLATDNTVAGPVTIADTGGVLNAGGVRSDIATANANTTMTINGAISGSSSATLRKNGPGTIILNAATNTFSGTVNLTDGILIVNGLLPAAVNLTNNSSSTVRTTLSGTGTIGGATQDSTSTIIAPGASAANGTVGKLTFSGDLTLGYNGQGQINMDLSSSPSGANDRIEVDGNLQLWNYTTVQINVRKTATWG